MSIVNAILSRYQSAIDAQALVDEGNSLRESGEYKKAREKLVEAKERFEECELARKVYEIDALILEIDEIIKKETIIQEADSLFVRGEEAFHRGDYEDALDFFQQSRQKYASVGFEKKVGECDEWIQKCEKELEEGFCLGTLLLSAFIFLGIFIFKRRNYQLV
ncbi:MAG: hypothetical protein WBA22_04860 [Candidatus Methanofastidiosia archaeon]